jgi:acylphosphatase
MTMQRLAIRISGRVHGVGFRFFSREAAQSLGVTGWVRNNAHRTVEMEAQGEQVSVELFCDKVRQGPRLAHVEDVTISEISVRENEMSFDIFH